MALPVFEPSPLADRKRLRWLQSLLASVLEEMTRCLPPEICTNIAALALDHRFARYLAVEYDSINAPSQFTDLFSHTPTQIRELNMMVANVDFPAVSYLSNILLRTGVMLLITASSEVYKVVNYLSRRLLKFYTLIPTANIRISTRQPAKG